MISLLGVKPGDKVADIGAGTGFIARRLAQRVGSEGIVYAEDIQPEMLQMLSGNLRNGGITNVRTVLGTETDPKLPRKSLDLVVMVDVYHEFDYPYEMLSQICAALKPNGRVAFVEFKAEDPDVPILGAHKMAVDQVKKETALFPLKLVTLSDELPRQHVIIFQFISP
jgi:ubiquinone/menaquinone biosynthesis C-methylase UbiE